MPNFDELYPGKEPILQIKILKSIALNGRLSQKEGAAQLRRKPSTISEAFKIMTERTGLIQITNPADLNRGLKRERFYKLSSEGILMFIEKNPSPYQFWIAIMWYCCLNPQVVDLRGFNKYYDLFIKKFVGDSIPLRSCFFLSNSFDNLFKKWSSTFDSRQNSGTSGYFKHHETKLAYKVLECLLQHRAVTTARIIELTQLTEQQVRDILKDYTITESNQYYYIDLYESVYQSSRSIDVTTDFLNHLVIIPIREREDGKNSNKDEKYELSLLGLLLVLGTISLMRRERKISSSNKYYDKIASNYKDKLPLIFGKWNLLKEVLRFEFFPSIFDYLFLDKSEILSLSILLGGNNEIYDNIRSSSLSTINKFFVIYDEGISALQSNDCPEKFLNNKEHYQYVQYKLNEIEMMLRYADLESFTKHLTSKKRNQQNIDHTSITFKTGNKVFMNKREEFSFEDDLYFIESALADEFSFLFYVGLMRENNHKASDYPLTTGFIRPSPNLVYPKDFLIQIAASDDQIRNKLKDWITESTSYQKLTLEKMNHIYMELNKG